MDDEMKVSSDLVRRLRNERGWSQEQLSAAAGLSLRTIQRVEGEGVASRETKVCLAAVFGVGLDALSGEQPVLAAAPAASPVVLVGYKMALPASAVALGLFVFGFSFPGIVPGGMIGASLILAIAAALYAGLGWYFQRSAGQSTPQRRAAQRGCVFLAIFWLFAAVSGPGKAYLLLAAQVAMAICVIWFIGDRYLPRRPEPIR